MGRKNKSDRTVLNPAAAATMPQESRSPNPNVLFFVLFGLIIVLGFSSLVILFSAIVSSAFGKDFVKVIYVTAAVVTAGSAITMALALLASLYCMLTFFSGLRSAATASASSSEKQNTTAGGSLEDILSQKVSPKSSLKDGKHE